MRLHACLHSFSPASGFRQLPERRLQNRVMWYAYRAVKAGGSETLPGAIFRGCSRSFGWNRRVFSPMKPSPFQWLQKPSSSRKRTKCLIQRKMLKFSWAATLVAKVNNSEIAKTNSDNSEKKFVPKGWTGFCGWLALFWDQLGWALSIWENSMIQRSDSRTRY